jgi:hypothetical protein
MPIMIGGDGSVKWVVDARNPREAYSDPPPQGRAQRPESYYHEGVSESKSTDRFWIRIRLPRDGADAFVGLLKSAIDNRSGGVIVFSLPIEGDTPGPKTEDQITIDWGGSDFEKTLRSMQPGQTHI